MCTDDEAEELGGVDILCAGDQQDDVEVWVQPVRSATHVVGPSSSPIDFAPHAEAVPMDVEQLACLSAAQTVSAAVLLATSNAEHAAAADVAQMDNAPVIAFDVGCSQVAILRATDLVAMCTKSASFCCRSATASAEAAESAFCSIHEASSISICNAGALAAASCAISAHSMEKCAAGHLEDCVRAEREARSLCGSMSVALEAAQDACAVAGLVSSAAHTSAYNRVLLLRDTMTVVATAARSAASSLDLCRQGWKKALASARQAAKSSADASAACDRVRSMRTHVANARPGTPEWYKQRMKDNLFPGSDITLQEAVYGLLMWKRTYSVGRTAMDTLMKLISSRMLPKGHILPPTLHLLQRVSEAQEWDEYEVHVCCRKGCEGHAWDYIPRAEWRDHMSDVCPHCKGPRFKSSNVTGMCSSCAHSFCFGGM